MKLFLLRHAEAEDLAPDHARPLSAHGRATIKHLAAFLARRHLAVSPTALWHSPLLRARQTATLFCESAGLTIPLHEVDGLRPMDDPRLMLERLNQTQEPVLLVGHNPHFELLANLLLLGDDRRAQPPVVNIPKASLLRFRRIGSGPRACWQLRDLLTTKLSGSP